MNNVVWGVGVGDGGGGGVEFFPSLSYLNNQFSATGGPMLKHLA